MHVDTLATHVVSAIINVDQEVTKPWMLLILDHQDNEHQLEMAPGDMVLYESAKLLHGRPGDPSPILSSISPIPSPPRSLPPSSCLVRANGWIEIRKYFHSF
jgi:hypothetical protein